MTESEARVILGLPPAAAEFLEAGQMAVAAALPTEDERWSEVAAGLARTGIDTASIGERLAQLSNDVPNEWGFPLLALVAVDHPWIQLEEMTSGSLHRRIDALYDIFETDYCAHEVQGYFFELVQDVRSWTQDPTKATLRNGAILSFSFAGGFASGYFGIPGSPMVSKAAAWLFDDRSEPSFTVLEQAKFLLAFSLLPSLDGELSDAARGLLRIARVQVDAASSVLTQRGPSPDRLDAYRGWVGVLHAISSVDGETPDGAPNLVHLSLGEAREVASRSGFILALRDVGRPPVDARMPLRHSGWRVVVQDPVAGAPVDGVVVRVGIVKLGERPIRNASAVLREAALAEREDRN